MKNRMLSSAWLWAVLTVAALFAQGSGQLGPKDGLDLPATDLNRVSVGTVAPDFTLETREGSHLTLSDLRGKKNVVLVFYRGHW